jgi:hypothetical protein
MTRAPVYRLSPDSDGLRLRVVRIRAQKEAIHMNRQYPFVRSGREPA